MSAECVIEKKVQDRIREQKNEEKRNQEFISMSNKIKEAEEGGEKIKIAEKIIKEYEKLSNKYAETIRELNDLRNVRFNQQQICDYCIKCRKPFCRSSASVFPIDDRCDECHKANLGNI